ncbi:hypothetical protein [Spirosoma endbachense]|uniref:DUF3570 domain-containing protein n=1 Tax=Spirosoma endbachense TaxID=2666025 RepID=A0A6P1W349_9BACT|nr:hypothetical protein [Spirosoma endbachense]QHV99314.1 hypothetical protein GJR95_31780 [Spirosoma endbachense]
MIKTVTLIIALSAYLTALPVIAQNDSVVPTNLGKLNFAVPDMPAFKALGSEPSTILRPSTPMALAATASQFYGNGNGVLPRNIAIEVAPLILIDASPNRRLKLEQYLKRRVFHSMRVSIGTLTDSSTTPYSSKLAVGLRFSLIDKGDLRYDRNFLQEVANILREDALAESALRTEFNQTHPLTVDLDDREKLFKEFREAKQTDTIEKKINAIKEDYKRKNWNKQKLDFALAWAGRSSDSLVKNLNFHRISGWLTLALPVKQWGQFLVGINYDNSHNTVEMKEEVLSRYNLALRLYAGTNRFKGYLESQYSRVNRKFNLGVSTIESNDFYLHLGGEYGILDGIWIQGYAGYQRNFSAGLSAFTGHLDLRFTIPEKIKL